MEDMEIFMDIFQSRDVHSLLSYLSLNLALFYYSGSFRLGMK